MYEAFYQFIQQLLPHFQIDRTRLEPLLTVKAISKGGFLLQAGDVWQVIGFTVKGCFRTVFIKDGKEFTLFFNVENRLMGDYESYRKQAPSQFSYQAIEDSEVILLSDRVLDLLFEENPQGQRLARLIAESYVFSLREKLLTLFTSTPEERYLHLADHEPELLQRLPQYAWAAYLGIEPESLSRLKRRLYQRRIS